MSANNSQHDHAPNTTGSGLPDHHAGWSSFTRFVTYATVIIIAILIVLAAVFVHRTTGAHPTA